MLDIESDNYQPLSANELANRRRAKRAEIKNRRSKVAAVGGAAGVLLLSAAFGPQAVKSFDKSMRASESADRARAMTYNGPYSIPSEKDRRRVLTVGETQHGITLMNVVSIADYIHKYSPNHKISESEAADLIEAENTQHQLAEGVAKNEVDPYLLHANEQLDLPLEYGVGQIVEGISDNSSA